MENDLRPAGPGDPIATVMTSTGEVCLKSAAITYRCASRRSQTAREDQNTRQIHRHRYLSRLS